MRIKALTILIAFIITTIAISDSVFAQSITWNDITNTTSLPEGVILYEGTRESPALRAWALEVDLSVQEIALVPYLAEGGTQTIGSFSAEKESFAAINGGFFGSGSSFSTLVQPGEVLAQNVRSLTRNGSSYPVIRSTFSIFQDRSMSVDWIYHFGSTAADIYRFDQPLPYTSSSDDPLPAPVRDDGASFDNLFMSVGGGPVLVKEGQVNVTYNEEIFWGSGVGRDNRDPRTAAGVTDDGKAILLVADGRYTGSQGLSLPELAQVMIDLGSVEAINLDGGGSSQMTVGTDLINRPTGGTFQRPVATFLAVMPADSIPVEEQSDIEQIIDTGDENATATSGWFESANQGFYGDTPSLIVAGGDGSETVTFNPDLPREGEYELSAWWVASFNRSSNAAFVVDHENGRDTVRVDQSTNTSRWNSLGTFTFSGTSDDQVIVSNVGSSDATFVVADAIRFQSRDDMVTSNEQLTEFESPQRVTLHPAYPNPFNPQTQLSFTLREAASVELTIYDMAGRRIHKVAEDQYTAGRHSLSWNAGNLSSGIYLLALQGQSAGGEFRAVQKLTLVK